jgi:hypothetical protein
MSNWIPPGHAENGTPGDTLWNRPDRGNVSPIAEIVDGLLAEADARLNAVAAKYGIPVSEPDPLAFFTKKYGGEAA